MGEQALRFGIVGDCGGWGRGKGIVRTINRVPGCAITALCDIDFDGLREANNEELGVADLFADYDEMLERAELDAVFIATPMSLHAPQAIVALERGVHVLSEVPSMVDMEQSRALVHACHGSQAVYMLAEN